MTKSGYSLIKTISLKLRYFFANLFLKVTKDSELTKGKEGIYQESLDLVKRYIFELGLYESD